MSIQFVNSGYREEVYKQQQSENFYNCLLNRYYEVEDYLYWQSQVDYDDSEEDDDIVYEPDSNIGISSSVSDKVYNIAVVDYCDDDINADIDLDGDKTGDMAHGNVVAHLIDSVYKQSNIYTFDISSATNNQSEIQQKLLGSLNAIKSELENGTCEYDALNMSLSSRITYSALSSALGVTITKDNVSQYQSEIRNWLLNTGINNGYSTTAQAVQLLEEIEELGCDVYIAAANVNDGTDDELNLYTIANGTTSVGALGTSGSKASFSFDNTLIDTWALGEIEVKKLYDSNGSFTGYDLNNDGEVDIDKSYNSGNTSKNSTNAYLKGTSFASPYELMQELNA